MRQKIYSEKVYDEEHKSKNNFNNLSSKKINYQKKSKGVYI